MASTSTGHTDIYHARLVKVIDSSSGQEPYNHQTGSKIVPKGSVQNKSYDNSSKYTTAKDRLRSLKDNSLNCNGNIVPPLPPRGGKSYGFSTRECQNSTGLSAKERFNTQTDCNRNFISESEQNRLPRQQPKSGENSDVQRSSCETPPPKLPPRTRPVSGRSVGNGNKVESVTSSSRDSGTTRSTPEPQPLTRINVTRHDKIWTSEKEEQGSKDVLSPPLNHITPATTKELFDKFDPLDVLDSASDHSDSSADTMIMMTTEEEQQNKDKITQSMKQYKTQKNQSYPENVQIKIDHVKSQPVVNNGLTCTKSAISQLSPKSEDTDDGYGTNSSQGTTVSSPLSSSLTSLVISDLENSSNQGSLKRMTNSSNIQENSAISNTARTTWAVRRRAKMTENVENSCSLQEKLRELAIIEEEENTHSSVTGQGNVSERSNTSSVKYRSRGHEHPTNVTQDFKEGDEISSSVASDLKKFEGDLYDKLTDMDRNYRNYYGFDKEFEEKKDNSKVLYFQKKVLKQSYGSDNYYNPKAYIDSQKSGMDRLDLDMSMPNLGQGSLPRHFGTARDYSGYESSSYRSNASSGIGSVDEQFSQLSNFSTDNFENQNQVQLPTMPNKGAFTSVDNIHQNGRRALFASSADIHKLFQSRDNIRDQLQRPASCRHSFHAMPCTQQWIVDASQNQASVDIPRQRAASASATMKSKSSWNPFGNMFSRKKGKNEQKPGNSTSSNVNHRSGDAKTIQNEPQILPSQKPIIKSAIKPSNAAESKRESSMRRLAEKAGLANPSQNGITEMPFRTVTLIEPSGTKLSTLV